MAIALADSAASGFGFGDTTRAVTFAATPSNDEIIVLAYTHQSATAEARTWPSGFTELFGGYAGGLSVFVAAAWKRASSEGSATYTLTLGGSGDSAQTLAGYRWTDGKTTGDPFSAVAAIDAKGGFSGDPVAASETVATTGSAHLIWIASNGNMHTPTASGYTSDYPHVACALIYKLGLSSGSTGAVTISNTDPLFSDTTWGQLILEPAGGGGGATYVAPAIDVSRAAVNRAGSW